MKNLFHIYNVGIDEARKIASSSVELHSHDYEELIVGMDGGLEHFIDFHSDTYISPFVSFVTRGKLHHLKPEISDGKFNMWVVEFKSEFIPETTFQLYYRYQDHANIQFEDTGRFRRVVSLCEMLYSESDHVTPDYTLIKHLLSTLFIMIEAERKKYDQKETGIRKLQNITFKNFLKILEDNYHRSEGVDFYAEKLFMSTRNLNLICQDILQKSATEIIEIRKLIEAKNLLISSDKTISEIAYDLGYNEKAYFTTVFKKKSGKTPTEFRDEMRKLIS